MVPQAIAYASIAGAPPQAGFYAASAAVLAYAVLGTCKELSVGPSTTPAITAASLVAAASVAPDQVPGLLAGLALGSGLILIASGFLRLGFIADFISRPVLVGFVSGIAIDIIVGQLPKLLGVPSGGGNTFHKLVLLLRHTPDTHWRTLAVGLAGLAGVLLLQRVAPVLPAALIVLAASIAASRILDLAAKGVAVVVIPSSGLPTPSLPHVGLANLTLVFGGGLALAFISYAESIGGARTIARRHGYEVDPNQELIALGGANALGSLIQGFPMDASLSRSAVAEQNRVRTPVYGLFMFAMLIATILWLTPLFRGLPQATLAAVIVGSAYRLIDVRGLRHLYRIDPTEDFLLALVALLGVLVFGALGGIATAVVASLVALIAKLYRPKVTVLGRAAGGDADEDIRFRDLARHPDCETFPGLVIVRFGGDLFFANASYLRAELRKLTAGTDPPVAEVILDASAIPRLDTTAADVVGDLVDELDAQATRIVFARATHDLRADLARFGRVDERLTFADSVGAAVAGFLAAREPAGPGRAGGAP